MIDHAHLFAFEDDFVSTLRCVPMAVRLKLDLAAVKLSLRQWSRFTPEERRSLLLQPCDTPAETAAYRDRLIALIALRTGDAVMPLPDGSTVTWESTGRTPEPVVAFASSVGVHAPSDDAWRRLAPLQRFVLLKLSRDSHDNVNFIPALKEFGLYRALESASAAA